MGYSMHCGAKMSKVGRGHYTYTGCGYDHYIDPKTTCGLITREGDEYQVLARRKFEPFKGSLDLVGGFVDTNETLEEALAREVKAELGVELNKLL